MTLMSPNERAFAQAVTRLTYCNPFLTDRIEYERQALGKDFSETEAVWNIHPEMEQPNVTAITQRAGNLMIKLHGAIQQGQKATKEELVDYENLVLFVLYHRYLDRLHEAGAKGLAAGVDQLSMPFYREFEEEGLALFRPGRHRLPAAEELPHIFAIFFQIRRAFHHIFAHIIGLSAPAIRLRAAVWESIFTHDMRRYRKALYNRMGDIATLVTGPSGTGKELVARAIGLSRYIPFDQGTLTFTHDVSTSFLTLNLSALSPTLIESELFGHCKGSFTGAVADRKGWLEICPAQGTVFLDEIGEIDPAIQVKLLRALEDRKFQRLGESKDRFFKGKVISATNRDLARRMQDGLFREDLYYRLCSDLVVVPSLSERICDAPEELRSLVHFIAQREIPEEKEALDLTEEVIACIQKELGPGYPWTGNIRELGQCVRNVLIRKYYRPPSRPAKGPLDEMIQAFRDGTYSAEAMMQAYCTLAYKQCGSFEETARRLSLDRRTVKAKVDMDLLHRL